MPLSLQECLAKKIPELKEYCRFYHVPSFSGKSKEWLANECCKGKEPQSVEIPLPKKKIVHQQSTEEMNWDKRQELEQQKYARERNLQEEKAKTDREFILQEFDSSINSIQPSNNSKIKTIKMTNDKELKWQQSFIRDLKKPTKFGNPKPEYTGIDSFPFCPENSTILKRIIDDGYLSTQFDERLSEMHNMNLSQLSLSEYRLSIEGNYKMIERDILVNNKKEQYELLVLKNDGKTSLDKMKYALLKRFRPIGFLNGSHCFDFKKSTNGKYYGIFLKKGVLDK